ncbi:MAG TPA: hypothetical protein VMV21_12470, partial [Vicinamibacteria bacterium]|nr:hypothetical protein [Vicinamibacteria bacterium]
IDPSLGFVLLAANDINDAQQIVGYAFNNFTGQTHAVRLRPTAAPPECTFHCLRSTGIELRIGAVYPSIRRSVRGTVTVQDENGAPLPGALVVGRWTRPDGSGQDDNVWTNQKSVAAFTTPASRGLYTLTIVNIVLSQYTFNPSESVVSKSIKVQ